MGNESTQMHLSVINRTSSFRLGYRKNIASFRHVMTKFMTEMLFVGGKVNFSLGLLRLPYAIGLL